MWLYLQYSLSIPSSLHFQIKISRQLQNRKEDIFGIIHWKYIYIYSIQSLQLLLHPISSKLSLMLWTLSVRCASEKHLLLFNSPVFYIQCHVSHPGGTSNIGSLGVEIVGDFLASCYPDVHIQTEVFRRRFVNQVLWQCLEHHHGGLGEDREAKVRL